MGMTALVLETPLTAQQREHLNVVRTSADALLIVIDDILDFSKIEAGKLTIDHNNFALQDVVNDTLKPWAIEAQVKGLQLQLEMEPGLPEWVAGDPVRLRQVLANLLGNAVKFTRQGSIVVGVDRRDLGPSMDGLHFWIRDTGVGIAPDKQSSIFEAFTQADNSTTRTFGGTGLGLTISNNLVQLMGGRMWLESVPGQGSTFHFTVRLEATEAHKAPQPLTPVPKPVQITSPVAVFQPAGGGRFSILVVEDNDINRRLIATLLARLDCDVTLCENGQEAVDWAQTARFDVVLMDVSMPVMDGLTATEKIRAMEGAVAVVPIVVITADVSDRSRDNAFAAGANDFITKPINFTGLLAALQRHIPITPRR
jgi:CheY-like chemotaxis protein